MREAWPAALPLFVRISATDWVEGGWTLEETVEFARRLEGRWASTWSTARAAGSSPTAKIPVGPGYQVPFARARPQGGGHRHRRGRADHEPEQAEQIVATGQADAVLLARELLRDPYWPLRAARRLGASIEWPKQDPRARQER